MLAMINNWRLATKTLVAYVFLGALVLVLGVNAYVSNKTLSDIASQHVDESVAGMSSLADLLSDVKELRIIVYSYYNARDGKDIDSLQDRAQAADKEFQKDLEAYRPIAAKSFQADYDKLAGQVQQLLAVNDHIMELRRHEDLNGALALIKADGKTVSRDAIDQIEALVKKTRDRAKANDEMADRYEAWAKFITLFVGAVAIGGLLVVWYMVGKTVATPMHDLSRATTTLAEGGKAEVPYKDRGDEIGQTARAVEQFRLAAIARAETDARSAAEQQVVTSSLRNGLLSLSEGDLTASIQVEYPAAYAELRSNFNEAMASLRGLIGSVTESAVSIRTGSNEIAQASEDLARRTEGNAASLEETSAAITQMDQRLRASASASAKTVERADGAIATVSGGRTIADEAVQAMTRVSESAKNIDGVIEAVDKIAFQTRVLAMNAAVEAGRAGEAGRGFAVVADLVSALAMRAEEEAGRARDQLSATQADIVAAVDMVQKVDGALANISNDVGSVHELLGNIAADNQAQSTAITQISVAIGTMDQSTQQNAAMVEQTSAAARNLTTEVASLAQQAQKFNTGNGNGLPSRGTRMPTRAPQAKAKAYVSPVKALPAAAMASPAAVGGDDWASF